VRVQGPGVLLRLSRPRERLGNVSVVCSLCDLASKQQMIIRLPRKTGDHLLFKDGSN
jgi:hypothetical protein